MIFTHCTPHHYASLPELASLTVAGTRENNCNCHHYASFLWLFPVHQGPYKGSDSGEESGSGTKEHTRKQL